MDSGYWKVVAEEDAQERLSFFTTDGKRWFKSLNEAPTFLVMMMKIKI